jgi:hypothetical protein
MKNLTLGDFSVSLIVLQEGVAPPHHAAPRRARGAAIGLGFRGGILSPRAHPSLDSGGELAALSGWTGFGGKPRLDSSVRTRGDLTEPFRRAGIAFHVARNGSRPLGLIAHLKNVGRNNFLAILGKNWI